MIFLRCYYMSSLGSISGAIGFHLCIHPLCGLLLNALSMSARYRQERKKPVEAITTIEITYEL